MENNKGWFEQIKDIEPVYLSADIIQKNLEELMISNSFDRDITILTGEVGMHEFNFAIESKFMGVSGSYLKTSSNYVGHILDGANKVYFRLRCKKKQFFVSTLNNKILFIGKSMTEALEFHKNSLKSNKTINKL